jgi:acyl-CoA synthetase (AMP-forming)/AMP-acid ligase II
MNIVEPILYQSKLNPFGTAIATPGSGMGSLKYGQLAELIHNVARSAIKSGLTPTSTAALLVADPILHAALTLGLMRIGVVTMALIGAKIPENVPIDVILTDSPQQFPGVSNVVAVNAAWLQGDGTAPDYERIYKGDEDDNCRIILTSGSTGRSKGIAFSHKVFSERISNFASKGPGMVRVSRLFSGFGIASSPGFRLMMYILSNGGTIYYEGRDLQAALQYMHVYGVQGYSSSPHQLDVLLKYFEADPSLKCSFDFIICQGARLSPQLADRARSRLCQNLFTSYGSTETTTVACGPIGLKSITPAAVGYICPGVAVDILDADGRTLPPGREGTIRIRSRHTARGYVGDPQSTAEMFRDGGFYPGDLGFVTPDGILAITGRSKTALLLSGDSIAPEMIEDVLCAAPGVEQAAVCALDNAAGISEVHALIVAPSGFDAEALKAHCASKLSHVFVPVRFFPVGSLPRGGQGKIDRPQVSEIAKALAQQS